MDYCNEWFGASKKHDCVAKNYIFLHYHQEQHEHVPTISEQKEQKNPILAILTPIEEAWLRFCGGIFFLWYRIKKEQLITLLQQKQYTYLLVLLPVDLSDQVLFTYNDNVCLANKKVHVSLSSFVFCVSNINDYQAIMRTREEFLLNAKRWDKLAFNSQLSDHWPLFRCVINNNSSKLITYNKRKI